jgi:hypothetical protein
MQSATETANPETTEEPPSEASPAAEAVEIQMDDANDSAPTPVAAPTPTEDNTPPPQPEPEEEKPQPAVRLVVKNSERRRSPSEGALGRWDLRKLKASKDPMEQAILKLQSKGIGNILYLSREEGSTTPLFQAKSGVSDKNKIALWTGLKWNPELTPELWPQFNRMGIVQLSPQDDSNSARHMVRTAFGATSQEWLTLIRVGSAQDCRGALALFSSANIKSLVEEIIPLLGTRDQKAA